MGLIASVVISSAVDTCLTSSGEERNTWIGFLNVKRGTGTEDAKERAAPLLGLGLP